MKWEERVARMEGMWNAYRTLVWKSERRRPLGRHRRRLSNNIKMDVY